MAREKQYVFSARTTEEGLKALNEVKGRLKVNWDELVIDAVSAHYNLDKAVMSLPKKDKPAKEAQDIEQQVPAEETTEERPTKAEQETPTKKHKSKGGKEKDKRSKEAK
jgi:hypothetical protein